SLRTLGTAARRLALRRLTTTHAGLGLLGAGSRTQVVDLERAAGTLGLLARLLLGSRGLRLRGGLRSSLLLRSLGGLLGGLLSHGHSTYSTVTRCATVATMPRISGRSSFTAVSPIRLRPRVRSVSRWFCLPPMADFVWVTLSLAIRRSPPQHGHAGARPGPRPRAGDHGARRQPRAAPGCAGPRRSRARC